MWKKPSLTKALLVAVIGVLAAWAVRIALAPLLGDRVPFVTFFPLIFIVAWWGGFRATLFTTALSALLVAYVILEPSNSFAIEQAEYRIGLIVFICVALGTGCLGEMLHTARWTAEQAASQAIGEREQMSASFSDQKRDEETLTFLANASKTLAALADRESTLQRAVRLPVPYLADWCVIYVVNEHGAIGYHAHAHRDPAKELLLDRMLSKSPLDWDSNTATVRSLRTGESQLMADLPETFLDSVAQSDEHRNIIRELGPRAVISVPLKIRRQIIGVIGLVSCDSRRLYTDREVRLAEGLAERISTAVDNARLFHAVKEASRQKDEFLAMLAHELRNPLAAIRYAIALGQVSPEEPPGELFQIIDRQTQNLARLIDDLLDVSRISRDKVTLRKEHIDLSTIISRAVATVRPLMEQKRHELVIEIDPAPMPVFVDPTRAEQIVANLLTNAAKYTREGGKVTVVSYCEGSGAILKVADTGIGLSPEMLSRVFDLFAQADRTLDRSEGGLGIGLTVARKLADMHGGSISAASEGIGRGSTFTVRLPLDEERSATQTPPASTRRIGAIRKLKILVVDDNRDTARSCAKLLQTQQHDVEVAFDGTSALDLARDFNPHLIFLDIGLPGLSGYDVASTLRSEGFDQVVLVAISGYGQPEDRKHSQEAGFDHHLVKPVDQAALISVLESFGEPVSMR